MKCLFYFGITSMKEDTSAHLSVHPPAPLVLGLGVSLVLWCTPWYVSP